MKQILLVVILGLLMGAVSGSVLTGAAPAAPATLGYKWDCHNPGTSCR